MNNPLIFTDPSGYRPDLIFEEEEMMRRSGGGTGFNYFGWINRSMSSVGWTDYTGPTWNQMNYWYDNIKGNKAFGQHSENIGYWWRNGMPTSPTGKDLLDGANMFVNEGYIPGAADFLFVDRYGTSIELTTIFSFLDKRRLDYTNSQALLEARMAEYTYGAYGMMMGDPPAANRGGDGIDEIGVDINYGFGYGYKTPFGSAQVKIGNAKVWSLKCRKEDLCRIVIC